MRQNIFGLFIGVLITGVALVRAENSSVARIQTTPAALVRQALANNPELKFYAAEIGAAKGTLKTAGTIRNPELNTEAGYKNARDNFGGPSGEGATWSVSVNQTFEYPGRIALRKAIAKGDIDLAGLHLQQFRLTLAARVRTLAYSISIAQERSIAAREVADRFQGVERCSGAAPVCGCNAVVGNENYRCEHAELPAARTRGGAGGKNSGSRTQSTVWPAGRCRTPSESRRVEPSRNVVANTR